MHGTSHGWSGPYIQWVHCIQIWLAVWSFGFLLSFVKSTSFSSLFTFVIQESWLKEIVLNHNSCHVSVIVLIQILILYSSSVRFWLLFSFYRWETGLRKVKKTVQDSLWQYQVLHFLTVKLSLKLNHSAQLGVIHLTERRIVPPTELPVTLSPLV